ncbi:MAG: hypothetical protein K2J11_04425 [Oscillospiraceae bacterium]|nr:hypothetical protein [Oscillospiraceae bacterium]
MNKKQNTAEIVADLATKLAYQIIISDLEECKSIDDINILIEKYTAKYAAICEKK